MIEFLLWSLHNVCPNTNTLKPSKCNSVARKSLTYILHILGSLSKETQTYVTSILMLNKLVDILGFTLYIFCLHNFLTRAQSLDLLLINKKVMY